MNPDPNDAGGWARNTGPANEARRRSLAAARKARKSPAGYPSIPAALDAVQETMGAKRGRMADLLRYLAVSDKTLRTWLSGAKWPAPKRLDQMIRWRERIVAQEHAETKKRPRSPVPR